MYIFECHVKQCYPTMSVGSVAARLALMQRPIRKKDMYRDNEYFYMETKAFYNRNKNNVAQSDRK